MLGSRGIDAEAVVVPGHRAGEEIVSYATSGPVEMIAMATHGRSGLGRSVMGSVSDYVLRRSRCPMLIIRPRETEGDTPPTTEP